MSARNHEVTAKQQLNSSEGDIVYEKKNLRLKYVLEKNPENLSERSAVGKSIAGKEKTGRFYYNQKINCMRAEGFAEYGCFMFFGEGAQPVLNVKNTLIHMKKCNIIH
jgi:hypothetical protein